MRSEKCLGAGLRPAQTKDRAAVPYDRGMLGTMHSYKKTPGNHRNKLRSSGALEEDVGEPGPRGATPTTWYVLLGCNGIKTRWSMNMLDASRCVWQFMIVLLHHEAGERGWHRRNQLNDPVYCGSQRNVGDYALSQEYTAQSSQPGGWINHHNKLRYDGALEEHAGRSGPCGPAPTTWYVYNAQEIKESILAYPRTTTRKLVVVLHHCWQL